MVEKEDKIQRGEFGAIVGVSDSCKDLIIMLLKPRPQDRPTIAQVFEHKFIVDHIQKNGKKFEDKFKKSRKKSLTVNPELKKIESQSASGLNSSSDNNIFLKRSNEDFEGKSMVIPPTNKHQPKPIDSAEIGSEDFMDQGENLGNRIAKASQFNLSKSGLLEKNKGQLHSKESNSTEVGKGSRKSLMQDEELDGYLDLVGGSKDANLFKELGSMVNRDHRNNPSDIEKSAAFAQPSPFLESVIYDESLQKGKPEQRGKSSSRSQDKKAKNHQNGKSRVVEESHEGANVMLSFGPGTNLNMPKKSKPEVHAAAPVKEMKNWENSILDEVEQQDFDMEDDKGEETPYDYMIDSGLADDKYYKDLARAEIREKELLEESQRPKQVPQFSKAKDNIPKASKEYKKLTEVDTEDARYEFSSKETESRVKLNPSNMHAWMDSKVNTER